MPIPAVMAEAEKQAAANKAEAINVLAKADANAATTRAAGVKSRSAKAEEQVATTLKAEARNRLSPAMVDYDLNLARINIIPDALAQAVKPIEKISDIRIFDTGSLLRTRRRALGAGGGNPSAGDGLASQLLSVSAFKPIIDRILAEAGFAGGPDALTNLTNALAAQQLAAPANRPPPTKSCWRRWGGGSAPSRGLSSPRGPKP